ncbi:MAG: hypothetical protein HW388_84 [Dehalococcoidia bacterium]|nr:hypothetical protein [Dehalococcoidia bacterium]
MAKNAEKPATKKHAPMKQGKPVPQVSEAFKEATEIAIKVHWRALKELEKH